MGETMNGNAPPFDPLRATAEEEADMIRGYFSAGNPEPKPALTSIAFDHGWRMRRNDKNGVVDDDQRAMARRYLDEGRPA